MLRYLFLSQPKFLIFIHTRTMQKCKADLPKKMREEIVICGLFYYLVEKLWQ